MSPFGRKDPMIKTPRETFAEAIAKYREMEASLQATLRGLNLSVAVLSDQKEGLSREVNTLVAERNTKAAELAETMRLLDQKRREHLTWVSDQLILGKAALDKAIADYDLKLVELEVDRTVARQEARRYIEAQSVLSVEREQFNTQKAAFEVEKAKMMQSALDDRSLLREIMDQQRTLTGILEEREKATRPIPQPTKIKGRR